MYEGSTATPPCAFSQHCTASPSPARATCGSYKVSRANSAYGSATIACASRKKPTIHFESTQSCIAKKLTADLLCVLCVLCGEILFSFER